MSLPAELRLKKKRAQTILAINFSFNCLPSVASSYHAQSYTLPAGNSAKMTTKHEKDKPYAFLSLLSKYEAPSC